MGFDKFLLTSCISIDINESAFVHAAQRGNILSDVVAHTIHFPLKRIALTGDRAVRNGLPVR